MVGACLAGAAVVCAGGCTTHTLRADPVVCHARDEIRVGYSDHACRPCRRCDGARAHSRCSPCRARAVESSGVRWDAVFPPPEVARFERRYDRAWAPEYSRNDAGLSPRDDGPIDAISASWPEPWRPDLDSDRTGRTSTDPERFMYSSRRAYQYAPRYRPQRRYWR